MSDFPIPAIIDEQTVENIHERLLSAHPDEMDKSEGQFLWDNTRGTALELAYFSQFVVVEALKAFFPKYSYGEYLDELADGNGLTRKPATQAVGEITVSGAEGTPIPIGSIFSTESSAGVESIDFETTQEATIPASGSVSIPIRCTEAGSNGNVTAQAITLKSSDLSSDISGVVNASATEGGTDEESDDALRKRIEDVEQSKGVSHVGSKADYKRWAESVDGVGEALVVPAQDDSGTVTIILTDANGKPASSKLCTEVYNEIIGTKEDESDRKVNVNATLEVKAPSLISITVTATVELDGTASLEEVKASYVEALNEYLLTASDETVGEVKHSQICKVLLNVKGVSDYSAVKLNGGTSNISLAIDELAVASVDTVTLTEGA